MVDDGQSKTEFHDFDIYIYIAIKNHSLSRSYVITDIFRRGKEDWNEYPKDRKDRSSAQHSNRKKKEDKSVGGRKKEVKGINRASFYRG